MPSALDSVSASVSSSSSTTSTSSPANSAPEPASTSTLARKIIRLDIRSLISPMQLTGKLSGQSLKGQPQKASENTKKDPS